MADAGTHRVAMTVTAMVMQRTETNQSSLAKLLGCCRETASELALGKRQLTPGLLRKMVDLLHPQSDRKTLDGIARSMCAWQAIERFDRFLVNGTDFAEHG